MNNILSIHDILNSVQKLIEKGADVNVNFNSRICTKK